MLCRQVIPDKENGIEQIYIVKSENEPEQQNPTDALAGTSTMDPEDVDVKQEPPSDDEHNSAVPSAANLHFSMLDVIIKEEPDELDNSGAASPVACSSGKRVKIEPLKQGEPDRSSDSESDDSGSDWSAKNKSKTGRKSTIDKSKSDSDSSDSSGVMDPYPVPRKENKGKSRRKSTSDKSKSDSDSSDSSGVMDPEPVPRKVESPQKIYNKRKRYPEDPPIRQNVIKRFTCHYCPKKFSTLYNRSRHEKVHEAHMPPEQRVHRKQNNCYICNKEHQTQDDLYKHLCVHADMIPYMCAECENPVKLSSVRLLNKHFQCHQQIETGIIKCRFCSVQFHSLSGCQQHEKGHVEKDKLAEAEARAEIESKRLNVKILIVDGLKRYECDHCKRSYTLLATLRRHVNTHTNEKAYVCKTCGKIFKHSTSLTLHEKVHTDFAPYKCETCGKGFKEVVRLVEHRQVIPDKKNGIEQIYIVKSDLQNTTDALAGASMEPEDVEVKQELPSDDEHDSTMPSTANLNFNTLDFIIKEESDKLDKSGSTSPEANSRGNCAKTIPTMQEEKGGKPNSSSDTESEDSGSDWSGKNYGQTGTKSESDSDSSDSSGVMDREEPVRRKVVESKKTNNKRKINSDGPPIRQNSIKRFDCHYCPEKFCNHYNRERHEKRHEARLPSEQRIKRKQHYCYICNKDHDTKDELHKHLCVHADMIPYLCAECENPTRLISVRLLNKHIQLHQQIETGIIKCRFCPARFHSLSGCQQHEKGHVDKDKQEEAEAKIENESKRLNVKILIVDGLKRYECEYCKRSYTQLVALRRHVKSHTNEEGFVCKTCGKVFNNYPSLAAHEKIHTDSAPYKCETCGRGFKDLLTLVGHRHIHTGDKPHACHCGLSFIKKGGLTKHKSKCDIPENLGSCACRFCQVSFPSYLEMIRHVQEIHAPDMEDTMCRFCPIMFKDAAQLAGHELRHELPGVLKCTQCTRIFKNKFYLDLHIKTHESSFTCHVCGKTFLHNVNLRVHRRVHSDKRPHVCDLCSTTFNCLGSLRKHRLTHYKLTSRNYIPGLIDNTVVEIDDDEKDDEEAEEELDDAEEGIVEPGISNANQNEDEQPEIDSNGITVD